jgi:hypothetical protein
VRLDERRAGAPSTAEAVAARWFAQDLFSDPNLAAEEPPEKDGAAPARGGKDASPAGVSLAVSAVSLCR